MAPIGERDWLKTEDKVAPSEWLAERARAEGQSAVTLQDAQAALALADGRFYEGRRMIANRAVQVERMLRENGVSESALSIITALSAIAEPGEHAGFGESCQHYVTARLQGSSREEALRLLQRKGLPAAVDGSER